MKYEDKVKLAQETLKKINGHSLEEGGLAEMYIIHAICDAYLAGHGKGVDDMGKAWDKSIAARYAKEAAC